jgi:DNA-binding CsgD family transcriptional regulator
MTPEEAKQQGFEPVDPSKEPEGETFQILPYEEPPPRDPSKTGNKPKQLVAVEVYGYEVGRGNRKRVVTPHDVYELAAIGCSDSEIARWFDIAESTLKYNFSAILAKGREDVKMTLRRAMLKNALNGNAVMQIWLSKNMLGMSDNPTNNDSNQPLPWNEAEDDADTSPE